MFEFGTNEVIVGRGAGTGSSSGLTVGSQIVSGQNTWVVVGVFEADGGVAETEIWCDARVLQGAYRRGNTFQTVLARLDSSDSFDSVPRLADLQPAAERPGPARNRVLRRAIAALTTLIQGPRLRHRGADGHRRGVRRHPDDATAVSTRSREIATLRALGFNTVSVLVSVLAESLALGAIGGVIGGLAAYLAFNGYQTSTMNFQTFSQVAFAFR